MKFIMLGSGAVGSHFGAKLQQAGHDVTFIARGARLRRLQEIGIQLQYEDGETHLPNVHVTDDLNSITHADYVLISVKTWQVEGVAQQLNKLTAPHTRFLTLQNGVEAAHIVGEHVGIARTLGGLVRGFFQMEPDGVVRHVGVQPVIVFGQIDGTHSPEAQQLLALFSAADIYAELSPSIEAALWEKFLLVTSLGSVGAVTRASVGEILAEPATAAMLRAVIDEIVAVARARGVALAEDVITRSLAFIDTFPYEATTSMQRDIMQGFPSELEAQTGAVVRLGAAAGIATPTSAFIYHCLMMQERRARATP